MYSAPIAAAAGVALAPAGVASGQDALQPPAAEFSAENGGGVYAKIQNPNDRGVCWAENADTGALFNIGSSYQTLSTEESVAAPGRTNFVSLRGLDNGPAHVIGRCADNYPQSANDPTASATEVATVEVTGAGIPLTGSAGR